MSSIQPGEIGSGTESPTAARKTTVVLTRGQYAALISLAIVGVVEAKEGRLASSEATRGAIHEVLKEFPNLK